MISGYIGFRTTLARWRAAQVSDTGKERERRPYLASECLDLSKAEKWRMQIIREIAKKVAQIQNGRLSRFLYVISISVVGKRREWKFITM
jgi:hypothetical protein